MKKLKIKYFSKDYPRLEKIERGDWIDLRIDSMELFDDEKGVGVAYWDKFKFKKGQVLKFRLGVAIELPKGFEAIVVPRSSTFNHWGLLQTNSMGVIDNSYCGDKDEWSIQFIATRDGEINRFDRVCQFRIQKNQPEIKFLEVQELNNKNRGGYGSTGKQ